MHTDCSFDQHFASRSPRPSYGSLLHLSRVDAEPARLRERTLRLLQKLRHMRSTADALDQGLATIAHELRAPLTSLRLLTEDLLDDQTSRIADRHMDVTHILQIITGMASTLDDLLDGVRLKKGTAAWSRFSLTECCREAVALVEPQVASGVRMSLSQHDDPLDLHGDADSVRRLIVNILCNACRHTHRGQIALGIAAAHGDRLRLTISDSGAGIEPAVLQRLGDPFARGQDRRGGSGLGLWLCRTIAAMHGGHLSVASTRGIGTTVLVSLQRDLPQPAPCRHPPPLEILPMLITAEAA